MFTISFRPEHRKRFRFSDWYSPEFPENYMWLHVLDTYIRDLDDILCHDKNPKINKTYFIYKNNCNRNVSIRCLVEEIDQETTKNICELAGVNHQRFKFIFKKYLQHYLKVHV